MESRGKRSDKKRSADDDEEDEQVEEEVRPDATKRSAAKTSAKKIKTEIEGNDDKKSIHYSIPVQTILASGTFYDATKLVQLGPKKFVDGLKDITDLGTLMVTMGCLYF